VKRSYLGSVLIILLMLTNLTYSEEADSSDGFIFTTIYEVETTPVKNQARSGTCWAFAAMSFFETELLREKNQIFDLSEMFFVHHMYQEKAQNYMRMHGLANFGAGNVFGDVLRGIRYYGLMPEEAYSGRATGDTLHNHNEMDAVLISSLDAIINNSNRKISTVWPELITSILDLYLGKIPEKFEYDGNKYSPKTFVAWLDPKPNNYIQLTSYIHHPFYRSFSLEIPDNWAQSQYQNIPLDEFMTVIDHALAKGYSVAWDGDVSEKSFSMKEGVAILPEKEWHLRTKAEKDSICKRPEPEIVVDQNSRQKDFDTYVYKDDHLMHLVGLAEDQNGVRYYKTKNSWGIKDSKYNGFIYMSESFVKSRTVSIMVAKKALPGGIAEKLGLD